MRLSLHRTSPNSHSPLTPWTWDFRCTSHNLGHAVACAVASALFILSSIFLLWLNTWLWLVHLSPYSIASPSMIHSLSVNPELVRP